MATNFNVSGMTAWVDSDPREVLRLTILEGIGTKDHYSWRDGVKYQTYIPNITAATVDISTGVLAGYNTGSGQTTFKDVTLTSTLFKIFETYTKAVLDTYAVGVLSKGQDPAEMPFQDVIMELKGKALFLENENMIWNNSDDASVGDLGKASGKFDGVIAQLYTINPNGTLASITAGEGDKAAAWTTYSDASIIQTVETLVTKANEVKPEYISADTVMSMSPLKFSQYTRARYNLSGVIDKNTLGETGGIVQEVIIPGTKIKVVAEPGLNGHNTVLLTIPENIIVCYDLINEDEQLDFWYNRASRYHELAGQYKLGVKVVDPSNCVIQLPTTNSTV